MANPMAQDDRTRLKVTFHSSVRGDATPDTKRSYYHVAAASTAADNMSATQSLSHAKEASTEHQALPYGNVARATEAAEHQADAATGRKRRFGIEDASIEPPSKKQDSGSNAAPQGASLPRHRHCKRCERTETRLVQ